jgi:type IV secretory pathway TrbF-like protein
MDRGTETMTEREKLRRAIQAYNQHPVTHEPDCECEQCENERMGAAMDEMARLRMALIHILPMSKRMKVSE